MMGTGAEMAVGVLWAVGAVFNAADSLRHSSEYFGEFAEQGWFAPARSIAARIILPNSGLAGVILMVFQTAVAVAILTRTAAVVPALVIGGCFSVGAAFFTRPGPAGAGAALAALQFFLAATH